MVIQKDRLPLLRIVLPIFVLVLLAGLLVACRDQDTNDNIQPVQTKQVDFYPIVFLHGYSTKDDDTRSWQELILAKLDNTNGFSYYIDNIYEESSYLLPKGLSKRTIFTINYYKKNKDESFGQSPGKIGGIPRSHQSHWNDYITYRHYVEYHANPDSYVLRLGTAIDNILTATGASKVILVGFSMGGLVARAYSRWVPDAKNKVYKILTIGTPNKGFDGDLAKLVTGHFFFEHLPWQKNGELEEMMNANRYFEGENYVYWLNLGWEEFCRENGIRYATIRGNKDNSPFQVVGGDGTVTESSAQIDGAEFNGVAYLSHTGDSEGSLLHSVYTAEVIKRWIFENRIHTGGTFKKYQDNSYYFMFYPTPFNTEIMYDYELLDFAVYASIKVFNIVGDMVRDLAIPLYPGINQPQLDLDFLSNGAYISKLYAYDMNGEVLSETHEMLRICCDQTELLEQLVVQFDDIPERFSTSSEASFTFSSNGEDTNFTYKLDENPWSDHSASTTLEVSDLAEGLHNLYISGRDNSLGYSGYPAIFSWIVNTSDETSDNDSDSRISIAPLNPTSNDELEISVGFTLGTPCYNISSELTKEGYTIDVLITATKTEGICAQVITEKTISQRLGALNDGKYTVYAYLNRRFYQKKPFEVTAAEVPEEEPDEEPEEEPIEEPDDINLYEWGKPSGQLVGTPNWSYTLDALYDGDIYKETELDEVQNHPDFPYAYFGVVFSEPHKIGGCKIL